MNDSFIATGEALHQLQARCTQLQALERGTDEQPARLHDVLKLQFF